MTVRVRKKVMVKLCSSKGRQRLKIRTINYVAKSLFVKERTVKRLTCDNVALRIDFVVLQERLKAEMTEKTGKKRKARRYFHGEEADEGEDSVPGLDKDSPTRKRQKLDAEVKKVAVLKQSGGGVIPLDKDVIVERTRQYNPDLMDMNKTTIFPALPKPIYEGPIGMHVPGIPGVNPINLFFFINACFFYF